MVMISIAFSFISNTTRLPTKYNFICRVYVQIQNPFLTAQSTQIKSVISVPIKDFIHHYPRALFNDIPRVGAHFNDIPGSGRVYVFFFFFFFFFFFCRVYVVSIKKIWSL